MSTSSSGPVAPAAEEAATPPARRGMSGTARNMILSMVIVVAACLIWLAMFPRVSSVQQPTADVNGIAREVGAQQRWNIATAAGLPSGWRPTNVRLISDTAPPTWQAGYDTPGGDYAAVKQTSSGTPAWVRAQTGAARRTGAVSVDGVPWTAYERDDGDQRALVRSTPLGGLATVVVGTGSADQLRQLAAALRPLAVTTRVTTG